MTRVDRCLLLGLLAALFGVPVLTLHAFAAHLGGAVSVRGPGDDPGLLNILALNGAAFVPGLLAVSALVRWWKGAMAVSALRGAGRRATEDGIHFTVVPLGRPLVFVAGWRRPAIVVSEAAVERMTPAMLRAALLHEDAHRRAGDHRWRAGVAMVRSAFGFLPGVGTLADAVVLRSEFAADREALAQGAGRRPLFEAVVLCADAGLAAPALSGGAVEARLARIADPAAKATENLPGLPLAAAGAWAMGLPVAAHVLLFAGILCHPAMG